MARQTAAARISLREYQRGLAARLINPETAGAVSRLGLQVGGERWLVNLADAGEVLPVPPLVSVPLTRPWFAGIANVRGNLYSVVDFSAFLGGAPAEIGDQTRLLLIGRKYRVNGGLLVDRVLGMFKDDQLRAGAAVPGARWAAAEISDGLGNRWKQLDMKQLVTHTDFLQAGI